MDNLHIIYINEIMIKIYEVLLRKHGFPILVYITTLWNQINNNKGSIVSHYIYLYQLYLDKTVYAISRMKEMGKNEETVHENIPRTVNLLVLSWKRLTFSSHLSNLVECIKEQKFIFNLQCANAISSTMTQLLF